MNIKPDQMTAYNNASKEIEKAAKVLETINLARLDHNDRNNVCALLSSLRAMHHEFYHAAHNCFLRERGFIKEEG